MEIEDLIPKGLLAALEEEKKSLVFTPGGWMLIDNETIQLSSTLPLILEKLEAIYQEVKKEDEQAGWSSLEEV